MDSGSSQPDRPDQPIEWSTIDAAGFSIPILYEDNHLLVVNKPPGLLTQGDHSGDIDLLSIGRNYIKEKYNKPGEVYLTIVHRLDRAVGGALVLARTSKAAARLCEQFRNHTPGKHYLAAVEGRIDPANGRLHHSIRKDERRRLALPCHHPDEPGCREATLDYVSVGSWQHPERPQLSGSLLEITLETGRFHQIRLQLALSGHPILGDSKYGSTLRLGDHRIALRAIALSFRHPTRSDQELRFATPPVEAWPFHA